MPYGSSSNNTKGRRRGRRNHRSEFSGDSKKTKKGSYEKRMKTPFGAGQGTSSTSEKKRKMGGGRDPYCPPPFERPGRGEREDNLGERRKVWLEKKETTGRKKGYDSGRKKEGPIT